MINRFCWQTLFSFVACLVVCNFYCSHSLNAQQIELLESKIVVVDEDDNPIEGATVYCTGMRTKVEPGSHWGWDEKTHGPLPKLKTNAKGVVMMPYPKYVEEKLDTGQMTWTVEHPDFVPFREDRKVEEPRKIKLLRGFRIAAMAIDGTTGKKITENLFGVIGGSRADWSLKKNGMLVSPTFAKAKSLVRICYVEEDKPTLFSKLIEIDPEDRSRVMLKDVKLFPGVRVEGTIDESVARPVKNGKVSATIVRSVFPNSYKGRFSWSDEATINKDGTFVFDSLPGDEVLQLIPVCDGWVPDKPDKAMVLKHFASQVSNLDLDWGLPQIFELEDKPIAPVLKMTKATSVRIRVEDTEGNPLPGAAVHMWPNQLWFDWGSQILGSSYSSREWLLKTRAGGQQKWERDERFSATTDDNGTAVIENLPPKQGESVLVELEGYEMPISRADSRSGAVEIKADEVAEQPSRCKSKAPMFWA